MTLSKVTYIAFKIVFMHSLEIEPMTLDAGFYSKMHTYFFSVTVIMLNVFFFFQRTHAKMTAYLSCVITCEHLCMCHSELFSLLTNLIFLFCPEPSNHSSRITSLWHIRIHLFIPTLHRSPIYPQPTLLQPNRSPELLGCSSSQLF